MSTRSPEEVIVANARRCVAYEVWRLMEKIASGEPAPTTRGNPFGGGDRSTELTVPGQALANALIARGLHKDSGFMAAIEEALTSTADGAMFSFFAAIEGEGHWDGEPGVGFATARGERVTGDLHGVYFQTEFESPKDD